MSHVFMYVPLHVGLGGHLHGVRVVVKVAVGGCGAGAAEGIYSMGAFVHHIPFYRPGGGGGGGGGGVRNYIERTSMSTDLNFSGCHYITVYTRAISLATNNNCTVDWFNIGVGTGPAAAGPIFKIYNYNYNMGQGLRKCRIAI